MSLYKTTNLSLLTSKDVSDLIIRKYNNNYIVGIVTEASSFLHKRKRFRPGGLFCEEIFGLLYKCLNHKCVNKVIFNENPILNKICLNCKRIMKFNFKRKYRFGAVFLRFPVINHFYFKNFVNLLKIFKNFRKDYFYKNNLFKINKDSYDENIFNISDTLENKFLNFINIFYSAVKSIKLFKMKLNLLNKKKAITEIKFNKFIKIIKDFLLFKKIFLTLFPILPTSLRVYALDNKKFFKNAYINYMYIGMINSNNKIFKNSKFPYNLKRVLLINFITEAILDFSKPKNVFGDDNYLYNKLHGKYGFFRQNLLGFRVDYSGRAVIVPEPSMPLHNIGLPFNMIYHHVRISHTTVNDDFFYESAFYRQFTFDKLDFFEYHLNKYSITINRAPTLHKMNVQSFNPVLVEGESIKLNPLLCFGYNADFDGDQMGAFTFVKIYSIDESLNMLRPIVNIHSPTTKDSIFNLTQGMSSGCYTLSNYNYFKILNSYVSNNYIDLIEHTDKNIFVDSPVLLRSSNLLYLTTCGRMLLNFNGTINE